MVSEATMQVPEAGTGTLRLRPGAQRPRDAAARRVRDVLLPFALAICLAGCTEINANLAQSHMQRGDAAISQKDFQAALVEFRKAIELDPQLAEGHHKLGLAYKQVGDLPRAADSLETAVQLDPFNFDGLTELGDVYRLMKDLTRAIRTYVQAVKLRPESFDANFRLASCYQANGDLLQAEAAYQDALRIDPDSGPAWTNLGAVYDARGESYKAIAAYKKSLETRASQPVVLVNLATVYLNQERFEAARKALESALAQDPALAVAHDRMGYCLWRLGKLDPALKHYQEAIRLGDASGRAHAGLGIVRMTQFLQNQDRTAWRDEAIEAWYTSLEHNPEQPQLRKLVEQYRPKPERPALAID